VGGLYDLLCVSCVDVIVSVWGGSRMHTCAQNLWVHVSLVSTQQCHYPAARGVVQVPRLQSVVRDRRANWAQSISTLEAAKAAGARVTKTSIMLGCGETPEEVLEAMRLLRAAGQLYTPSHTEITDFLSLD
jgi:lipoate synthase